MLAFQYVPTVDLPSADARKSTQAMSKFAADLGKIPANVLNVFATIADPKNDYVFSAEFQLSKLSQESEEPEFVTVSE